MFLLEGWWSHGRVALRRAQRNPWFCIHLEDLLSSCSVSAIWWSYGRVVLRQAQRSPWFCVNLVDLLNLSKRFRGFCCSMVGLPLRRAQRNPWFCINLADLLSLSKHFRSFVVLWSGCPSMGAGYKSLQLRGAGKTFQKHASRLISNISCLTSNSYLCTIL
jgi:hypothetical protein